MLGSADRSIRICAVEDLLVSAHPQQSPACYDQLRYTDVKIEVSLENIVLKQNRKGSNTLLRIQYVLQEEFEYKKITWQDGLLPTAAANIRGVHLEKENKTDVFNTPGLGFTVDPESYGVPNNFFESGQDRTF